MAYRISVPEYEEIAAVYTELADEGAQQLRVFHQKIEENCRKTKYKPMVDFVNQICEFYDGDFRSHLMGAFHEWESSKYSLDNLTRAIGAGEDAAQVGKRYMNQIENSVDGLFSSHPLQEINIDTSMPEIDNEMILRNTEYINSFLKAVESARDYAVRTIESRAAENDAYVAISGFVRTTGNSMIESFQTMLTQVEHGEELFDLNACDFVKNAEDDRGTVVDIHMNWPYNSPIL